jgi:cytochrome c-type biogenesis protein CcmH
MIMRNSGVDNARLNRRNFLYASISAGVASLIAEPASATVVQQAQDSLAAARSGALRDPSVVGRSRQPTDARDNAEIQAIEQRLACSCGCTLDVFTCRTTDFTCTYSPELHREVLALRDGGKTAQEILDTFVAKYGEKALMAPKPRGFNLAGYFLPGTLIASAGAALVFYINRRRAVASVSGPPVESIGSAHASPEELERLRRALADIED